MNIEIADPHIKLELHRCFECGRWWALECGFIGTCPNCAGLRLHRAHAAVSSTERSNRSLRAAFTALKRRVAR